MVDKLKLFDVAASVGLRGTISVAAESADEALELVEDKLNSFFESSEYTKKFPDLYAEDIDACEAYEVDDLEEEIDSDDD